jgi:transposase
MMIIGVDYHPSDQYVAFVDTETGECGERRLNHSEGEAEKFYRELAARGVSVCAWGWRPRVTHAGSSGC